MFLMDNFFPTFRCYFLEFNFLKIYFIHLFFTLNFLPSLFGLGSFSFSNFELQSLALCAFCFCYCSRYSMPPKTPLASSSILLKNYAPNLYWFFVMDCFVFLLRSSFRDSTFELEAACLKPFSLSNLVGVSFVSNL